METGNLQLLHFLLKTCRCRWQLFKLMIHRMSCCSGMTTFKMTNLQCIAKMSKQFKKIFLIKSDKFILVIIYSTRKTGPEVLYTYTTYYRHLQKPSPGYENANEL